MAEKSTGEKSVATNKKAFHEYFILEKIEAGIILLGTEVKAIREGRLNLKDSYAMVQSGEMFLFNCHISPYSHGNRENHEPLRIRKLLLHKREIMRLYAKVNEQGHTLVPLRIYFKKGKAKVVIALVKGKREYDKRHSIREREQKREVDRARKQR